MKRSLMSPWVFLLLALTSAPALAQSTFMGRVLSDSGVPIAGAEVVIARLLKTERTNDKGEFRLTGLPGGDHIVGVRKPGFAPKGDTIEVADAGDVRREYRLARIVAELPEVDVRTTLLDRKLLEFHERRRMGVGRFMDSTEFANARGTRTSDRLAKFPAVWIVRGRGSAAYVANTRSRSPDPSKTCRANVWLDNVNLGIDFNVNELDPSIIAAVEWYAGPSTVPMRFATPPRPAAGGTSARPQPYCGVLVIWLR